MAKKEPSRPAEAATDAQFVARLQRDLADRERQLRDLTEQALGFLEELAEARRLDGDRERLAARIGELERVIADARSRLQHAGGCAPSKRSGKGRVPALEVVFWGEGSLARAVACRAACGDVPVRWVGPPTAVPADPDLGGVATLVHRDAHTPAQCWNLGLVGTEAAAVLFVGPGTRLAAVPALPELAPNVALLAPRLEPEGAAAVGCVELDALRLVPRPLPEPPPEAPFPVPWVAPRAFVVRRAAYERLGAFDEGLLGAASLLDFTLRARRANFDVVGFAGLAVEDDGAGAAADEHDRERLFVLAQHRPEQLGRALAEHDELWRLAPAELAGYVAAVLARLPAGDVAVQRAVLERLAAGLVGHALPSASMCALVQSSRVAVLRSAVEAGLAHGDELAAALQRAEGPLVTPAAAAFEALGRDIALCRNAALATARTLEQTRAERREIDTQRHAQSARAERAEGARAATAQQLEQVQTWLREAQAELKRVQERRVDAEREIAEARLAGQRAAEEAQRLQRERQQQEEALARLQRERDQQEEQRARLQQQVQQTAAQLEQERARTRQAEERLAAQLQSHRELEREFLAADRNLRSLHEHTAELARIVGLAGGSDRDGLQHRLQFLHQEAEKLARTLQQAGAADERALLANLDRLARQLADSERTLRERERWIALLLQEVTSRRLFPRALQDHERAFVDRVGRLP
ncbi:MAG: hypothetical protein KF830_07060 [Planctomycetes bacterium]|nr:hypothetical protein [Planctomycetota bacterium]